jgi:hypothetical protein
LIKHWLKVKLTGSFRGLLLGSACRSNNIVTHELGISPRTVEIHRAHIMTKMEASSLSDLVRLVLAAEPDSIDRTIN